MWSVCLSMLIICLSIFVFRMVYFHLYVFYDVHSDMIESMTSVSFLDKFDNCRVLTCLLNLSMEYTVIGDKVWSV